MTSSHHDNHVRASPASQIGSNGTLETYKKDKDDEEADDDEHRDDDDEPRDDDPRHHQCHLIRDDDDHDDNDDKDEDCDENYHRSILGITSAG